MSGYPGDRMNASRKAIAFEVAALVVVLALIAVFTLRRDGVARVDEDRLMMGTIVSVTAYVDDAEDGEALVEEAFAAMNRVEGLTTSYSDSSVVATINAGASAGEMIHIVPEVAMVIARSCHISKLTGGAFDITIAPLMRLWDFDEAAIPDGRELAAAAELVDYSRIFVHGASGAFRMPDGMALDLDAVAKGHAVDRGVNALRAGGVSGCVVDAGGDIGFHGEPPDGLPWRVGIKHPREDGMIGTLELDGGAVATSGDYQHFVMVDGERYHHILDPDTGMPSRGAISVTAIASTAMDADALATAIFVLGPTRGMAFVEGVDGAEAVIITGDVEVDDVLVSSGLRDRFIPAD